MPAVPAIIMGGSALGSAYMAKKAAENASANAAQRSPEEMALLQQQGQQAKQLFGTGMPAIQQTLSYYNTLLRGGRGARMAAAGPEAGDLAEAYKGADAAVKQRLVGGERDQALAENARSRAGQIARLVTGQRPGAASAMASIGSPLIGASQGAVGGLLDNMMTNRLQANQAGQQAGSSTAAGFGQLLALLGSLYGGGKGGTKGFLPSRPLVSPIGGYGPTISPQGM